jgi:hypothetical protein
MSKAREAISNISSCKATSSGAGYADEKRAASKKPAPPLSAYERTITKKIKEDKRKQKAAGKDVAQLGQQAQQWFRINMVPT